MTGVLLICLLVTAGSEGADNTTTGAAFLTLSPSAAAIGRGRTGVGHGEGVFDLFYNPAHAVNLRGHSLGFTHTELLAEATYEYLGYVAELNNGFRVGVDLSYVKNTDIRRDAIGRETGKIQNHDYCGGLIVARQLFEQVDAGVKLKLVKQQLDSYIDETFSADAGVVFRDVIFDNLNLGLSATNIGGEIKFIRYGDDLPLTFNGGAYYSLFDNQLRFYADVNKPAHDETEGGIGFEYQPMSLLVFRGGFKLYEEVSLVNSFSAGLGIRQRNWVLDYGYEHFENVGNTHRISYGVSFGSGWKSETKARRPDVLPTRTTYFINQVVNLTGAAELEWLRDGIREIIKHNLNRHDWGYGSAEAADVFMDVRYEQTGADRIRMEIHVDRGPGQPASARRYDIDLKRMFDEMAAAIDDLAAAVGK